MALLKLIDLGILPPDVKGAWAGEIGQTQILPKDYLEKASTATVTARSTCVAAQLTSS
jgi:membrane-bound lytic murein transglycosylase B